MFFMPTKHNLAIISLTILGIAVILFFGLSLSQRGRQIKKQTENPFAGIDRPQIYSESPREGKGGKVVLFEYASFTCPHCRAAQPLVAKMYGKYKDKILHVWKDFPHDGDEAKKAAIAARCAGEQGKFWQYHDWLYTQDNISDASYTAGAGVLKLDEDKFAACLGKPETLDLVERDLLEGYTLGIDTAPTIVLGDRALVGEIDEGELEGIIEEMINKQ